MVPIILASVLTLAAAPPQLAVTLTTPAAASSAARTDPNLIQPDPAIRRGELPNGMRYAVMRNALPGGGLSLRLGVNVGSFDEADHERGAAHFVEHMVFNGSRNFPEGEIDKIFQPLGVAFGKDQNAATALFSTVYGLDLHSTDSRQVETAVRWLRDVADGALFDPAAVERERGVILAEREQGLTSIEATRQALIAFHGRGLRATSRDPIGVVDTLRSLDAAGLRSFYQRWYRPEHAVVVVVGDLPSEVLEQRVKEAFSSWRATGPAPARALPAAPDGRRPLEAFTRYEPNIPTVLEACRARPADPLLPDDVAGLRRRTASVIWRRVLEGRIARAALASDAAVLSADVDQSDHSREAAASCISVVAADERWRDALSLVVAEFRRLAEHGPTDQEFEAALEEMRSAFRGAVAVAPTRDSATLAQTIVEGGLNGAVIPSPREAFRAYDSAVEDMTPDDVKAAIARDWSGHGPLVSVIGRNAPDEATVTAAWRETQDAPLMARYEDPRPAAWAYPTFGKAGAVADRRVVADGDFVRLSFRNGVVVNFKRTGLQQEEVLVDIRFGTGRRGIPNSEMFLADMAASAFKVGGLGRQTIDEVYSRFSPSSWEANLRIDYDAFRLRGRTNAATLDRQLSILAAFMSDPGFRPALDGRMAAMMRATYRSYKTSPELMLSMALSEALDPVHGGLPEEDELARLRARDFERVLKPHVVGEPIEISIAGDVDENTVVKLVAATFGALPKRQPQPERPAHVFPRVTESTPRLIQVTHQGPSEKAIASLVWPLYVATPERRREEMAINLTAEILNNNLRRRIREDLGKSYAPQAGTMMPDKADQGLLSATIEAAPSDIEDVVAEARALATALAQGRFDEDDLDAARQPFLSGLQAEARTNAFWIDVMSGSARDPQRAADIVGLERLVAAIGLNEVRQAAADWLTQEPLVVIATPKAGTATTAQVRP